MSILNKELRLESMGVTLGDKEVLTDITLNLASKKIYTVIGPSGTGKSTLLRVIAGLQAVSTGSVSLASNPYDASQHIIGLVPQNYGLLPWQTAWDAVVSSVKISRHQKKLSKIETEVLDELFKNMNLETVKNAYPSQMSGGQKQRVAIVRAFAINSDILLMDEPFSALDAFSRERAQKLFLELWHKEPKRTLFITHDIEEALLLGHFIIVLKGQPGYVAEVRENPLPFIGGSNDGRRNNPDFYEEVQLLRRELS